MGVGLLSCGLLAKEAPEIVKTTHAITTAIGCPRKVAKDTTFSGPGTQRNQSEAGYKLPLCWLAHSGLEDAVLTAGERLTSTVVRSANPESKKTNQPGKMYPLYNSVKPVMGSINHFLLAFEPCSIGGSSLLVL